MIGNLEAQEFVNRCQSRFVIGGDGDPGAARCFLKIPVQVGFELRHRRCSGDVLAAVYQHRHIKVSRCEHLDDVVKVAANLIPAVSVFHIVRPHVDEAAILVQLEMMRGFLMRESHFMIAALVQRGGVIVLGEGQSANSDCSEEQTLFHEFKDGVGRDWSRTIVPLLRAGYRFGWVSTRLLASGPRKVSLFFERVTETYVRSGSGGWKR